MRNTDHAVFDTSGGRWLRPNKRDRLTSTNAGLLVFALRMGLFRNRTLLLLSGLLALLVFGGDVLDDVWTPPGAALCGPQNSDQQSGGSTKTSSTTHDDTVVVETPSAALIAPILGLFVYLDLDQQAPVGAVRAIDHPPQLA